MFGKKEENRFELWKQEVTFGNILTDVIKDKETGVLYISKQSGRGGGMTVLVDREGKPLLDLSHEER